MVRGDARGDWLSPNLAARSYLSAIQHRPAAVSALRDPTCRTTACEPIEVASLDHAALHAARFRAPAAPELVQSALLQSLHALAACEAARTLPLAIGPDTVARKPAPAPDAPDATFTVVVRAGTPGKRGGNKRGGRAARRRKAMMEAGGGSVTFEVRPFAVARDRRVPRLAFPAGLKAYKRDLHTAAELPAYLLTLPPECLFFGDRLPAGHCDAVPTYTVRSALWSAAMLALHAAQPSGASPLLRARRPVGCTHAPRPRYTWRVPAPAAFVADVANAFAEQSAPLARVLVPATLRGAARAARVRDIAHYTWGLVEMLGLPDPATDLEADARQAFAHSTLFALVQRHADALQYARMRASDVPAQRCCGWLLGVTGGPAAPAPDPALERNLRRQRPTFRAMLAWDQWRGRHRPEYMLRKLLGALVEGPLVRHVRPPGLRRAPATRPAAPPLAAPTRILTRARTPAASLAAY